MRSAMAKRASLNLIGEHHQMCAIETGGPVGGGSGLIITAAATLSPCVIVASKVGTTVISG
jgi:hypothetical protein